MKIIQLFFFSQQLWKEQIIYILQIKILNLRYLFFSFTCQLHRARYFYKNLSQSFLCFSCLNSSVSITLSSFFCTSLNSFFLPLYSSRELVCFLGGIRVRLGILGLSETTTMSYLSNDSEKHSQNCHYLIRYVLKFLFQDRLLILLFCLPFDDTLYVAALI